MGNKTQPLNCKPDSDMHNTVFTFFLKQLVPTADLCENVPLKALLLKCKDKTHLFYLVLFSG